MKLRSSIPLLLLSLALVAGAVAQFQLRGTIGGLVTDITGAVIVNATVTLTDLERNQSTVAQTNDGGLFSFPNLVAGNYQVSVEQEGFKTGVSDIVVITTNDNVRVDIAMEIGDVTETVEVTTAAPLIQTEQTVVGQVVDETLVEALPALGRNFLAFSTLAPNVSSFPRTGAANATWSVGSHHTVGGIAVQVGGGGDNGLYMNGVNINDSWLGGTQYSPSMENVQEVKVDTANFSAASGRDISMTSVMTKAGTNEFHGGLFNYLQNEALNAWNPFIKAESEAGQRQDKLQRNQFGGNIGGPAVRNRAFFFFGYEGMDNNSGSVDSGSFGGSNLFRVPTGEERQGDYSGLVNRFPGDPNVLLYNPFTTRFDADGNSIRDRVVNNDLRTTGMINQTALAQINDIYPTSNGFVNTNNPDDLRNHRVISKRTNFNWRIDTRFDYRITDNDNVYVSYSESLGLDDNRGGLFPDLDRNVEDSSYVLAVSYARVFTPTLTNDFTFGFTRPNLNSVDQGTMDKLAQTDTPRNRHFQNLGDPNEVGFGMHSIRVGGY
ncbi:MAG: carboxypeptidase regulatory-like domain-containing protein, partial [Acidobacteriia bacterium]|nr:carboxypeptidase regulatory-like domain-containing protein [Terriglobia bacterium]